MASQMNAVLKNAPLSVSFSSELAGDRSKSLGSSSLHLTTRKSRASDPGNKPAKALDLGIFPGTQRYSDTVGKTDPDFYRITLDNSSSFKLTFRNRSNVDISASMTDALGNLIRGDAVIRTVKPGKTVNQVYRQIPAGTYFLSVKSSGTGNRYNLKATATTLDPNQPSCGCGS